MEWWSLLVITHSIIFIFIIKKYIFIIKWVQNTKFALRIEEKRNIEIKKGVEKQRVKEEEKG